MTNTFQLRFPGFEGDPPALLQCVERQALDLDALSIADITCQYSQFMTDEGWVDLHGAGEFLSVAARLMILKSELLLPRAAEPAAREEHILDVSLLAQRERLLGIAGTLRVMEGNECFAATPVEVSVRRVSETQAPSLLLQAWADMKTRSRNAAIEVSAPAFVRLEVALSRLMRRLRSGSSFSFSTVLRGASRSDAVIHFLALLELVRRKDTLARQRELFGDINCEPRAETDSAALQAG